MDGDRLSVRVRPWSVCVWKGWRRSSDDHLHRSRLDLSRGSSNAAGGVERRLTAGSAAPMPDRELSGVLHVGSHREFWAGLQALDLVRHRRQNWMQSGKIGGVSQETT